MGLDGMVTDTRADHEVFALRVGTLTYLIPAFVLLSELPGTLASLEPYLLSHGGLQSLCALTSSSIEDDGTAQTSVVVRRFCQPRRVTTSPAVLARLTWMRAFPTGNRLWTSVLNFAQHGRLDLIPPAALLTVALKVRKVGDVRIVDHLTVRELKPLERPFAAEMFDGETNFVLSALHTKAAPVGYDRPRLTDIEFAEFTSPLSDEEWWLYGHLLVKTQASRRNGNLRTDVDFILQKLASGLSWRHGQSNSKTSLVHTKFLILRREGRWEPFKEALLAYRRASAKGPPSNEFLASVIRPLPLKDWACAKGISYDQARTRANEGLVDEVRHGRTRLVHVPGTFYRTHVLKSRLN
ncbi:hypothetical protein [Pseudorhodoferax soli]|nr:hypothetical protein [Pseudorhodoferax soli]